MWTNSDHIFVIFIQDAIINLMKIIIAAIIIIFAFSLTGAEGKNLGCGFGMFILLVWAYETIKLKDKNIY